MVLARLTAALASQVALEFSSPSPPRLQAPAPGTPAGEIPSARHRTCIVRRCAESRKFSATEPAVVISRRGERP